MQAPPPPVPVKKNMALAALLVSFVGGVYYYTYSKMRNNELAAISADLDEVRKLTAAVNPASAAPAAAASPPSSSPKLQ